MEQSSLPRVGFRISGSVIAQETNRPVVITKETVRPEASSEDMVAPQVSVALLASNVSVWQEAVNTQNINRRKDRKAIY